MYQEASTLGARTSDPKGILVKIKRLSLMSIFLLFSGCSILVTKLHQNSGEDVSNIYQLCRDSLFLHILWGGIDGLLSMLVIPVQLWLAIESSNWSYFSGLFTFESPAYSISFVLGGAIPWGILYLIISSKIEAKKIRTAIRSMTRSQVATRIRNESDYKWIDLAKEEFSTDQEMLSLITNRVVELRLVKVNETRRLLLEAIESPDGKIFAEYFGSSMEAQTQITTLIDKVDFGIEYLFDGARHKYLASFSKIPHKPFRQESFITSLLLLLNISDWINSDVKSEKLGICDDGIHDLRLLHLERFDSLYNEALRWIDDFDEDSRALVAQMKGVYDKLLRNAMTTKPKFHYSYSHTYISTATYAVQLRPIDETTKTSGPFNTFYKSSTSPGPLVPGKALPVHYLTSLFYYYANKERVPLSIFTSFLEQNDMLHIYCKLLAIKHE